MAKSRHERQWFWATLALSSLSIVAVVFAAWELVESHFFRDVDYLTLHYLYISRGIVSSLLLACWAAWFVLRERKAGEAQLRRSHERYRGILEASPGAVALYDKQLRVGEWNAAAERLYGYSKGAVLGNPLPTVPAQRAAELQQLLDQVEAGLPALDLETERRTRQGECFAVQLSLLPFRELSGESFFLEVTYDIRERVRLREKLLELEKLTTMGQMAAGTAHHLNTPLASMLLRVQMMRERAGTQQKADLEQLEASLHFCQQFVRRLLDFSRRPQSHMQPEPVRSTLESVLSFLAPQLLQKQAQVDLELNGANGARVLADRNQLEALFLILLSNSLDAIGPGGSIAVRCLPADAGRIAVEIADDGCGIEKSALEQIFQPFFTTKPPGKGTGLGLAIARNILHEHGGVLRLESAPRRGTVAVVELPRHQEGSAPRGGAA